MTPVQHKVLAFIVNYRDEVGISPSYHEIADAMGFSRPRAHNVVAGLAAKNHIVKTGRGERCIEIVGAGMAQLSDAEVIAEFLRRKIDPNTLNKGAAA